MRWNKYLGVGREQPGFEIRSERSNPPAAPFSCEGARRLLLACTGDAGGVAGKVGAGQGIAHVGEN